MFTIIKSLKIISCLSVLLCALGQTHAMQISENLTEFVKNVPPNFLEKHSVSPALRQLLDKNLAFPLPKQEIHEFPWLPGYVIKSDHTRVYGAVLINQCVQKNNLTAIVAPNKQVYSRDVHHCIVIPKIKADPAPFTLQQIKQLYKLCKLTNYYDIHNTNVWNTKEGIMVIIDTEQSSFHTKSPAYLHYVLLGSLRNIKQYLSLDADALAWVTKKIEKKFAPLKEEAKNA